MNMNIHIYIYMYIYIHMHMYTYVHVIILQSSVLQYSTLLLQYAFQCDAVCIAVHYRA